MCSDSEYYTRQTEKTLIGIISVRQVVIADFINVETVEHLIRPNHVFVTTFTVCWFVWSVSCKDATICCAT